MQEQDNSLVKRFQQRRRAARAAGVIFLLVGIALLILVLWQFSLTLLWVSMACFVISSPFLFVSMLPPSRRVTTKQTPLARVPPDTWATHLVQHSPDMRRVAYVQQEGSQQRVIVNGQEGRLYEGIGQGSLVFSPDSQQLAYVAKIGGGVELVETANIGDIHITGLRQTRPKQMIVVVGGEDGKPHDGVLAGTVVFSPDSCHLAYVAAVGDRNFVVLDGKEGTIYDAVWGDTLRFSPDSRHLTYVAQRGQAQIVVLDGQETDAYEGVLEGGVVFSPDSQRLAFAVQQKTGWAVILDRSLGKTYAGIGAGSLTFSPDSLHLAYVVQSAAKQRVILDGEEAKSYTGIAPGNLVFSPDSQQLAYIAVEADREFVVVNGKEGRPYDKVLSGGPVFSPDGQHLAYAATTLTGRVVVVDEKECKGYSTPVFSADSQWMAFTSWDTNLGKPSVYVTSPDKLERGAHVGTHNGIRIDGITFGPEVSPGCRLLVYIAVDKADKETIVLGVLSRRGVLKEIVLSNMRRRHYDTCAPRGVILFDSFNQLHYLATIGEDACLVEEIVLA